MASRTDKCLRWVARVSLSAGVLTMAIGVGLQFHGTNAIASPLETDVSAIASELDRQPASGTELAQGAAPLAPLDGDLLNLLSETVSEWDMQPGETLRSALTRWCEASGWSLAWRVDRDFPIDAPLRFKPGTSFSEAVRQTMRAVWQTHPGLKARMYQNNVIVVTEGV